MLAAVFKIEETPLMLVRALLALACVVPAVALANSSPYAGQETRIIKSLSSQDMDDLLQGRGMGLAKAAELNGYPGPAHALDLAAGLGLSGEQVAALRDAKDRMTRDAKTLGGAIVERERLLDRAFAEGRIDEETVSGLTADIGRLQGRLRAVHLSAHLDTRAVLSAEQVQRYGVLRGYQGEPAGGSPAHGHHGAPHTGG